LSYVLIVTFQTIDRIVIDSKMKFLFISVTLLVTFVTNCVALDLPFGLGGGSKGLPIVGSAADNVLKKAPLDSITKQLPLSVPIVGSGGDDSAGTINSYLNNREVAAAPKNLGSHSHKKTNNKLRTESKQDKKFEQFLIPTLSPPEPGEKYNFGPPIAGVGEDDIKLKESLCKKGDDSCLDNFVKAEPETQTPKSLKEKLKQKLSLQKEYDKAIKEGAAQAEKENKASGGAPAFGGLQLPDSPFVRNPSPVVVKQSKQRRNKIKTKHLKVYH
jgi:hypothetical protein